MNLQYWIVCIYSKSSNIENKYNNSVNYNSKIIQGFTVGPLITLF